MTLRLITDHEVKALLPYAFKHSVAILLYYDDIMKCKVGSGSLIQIGSHYFIATAAHNLFPHADECIYIGCSKERSADQIPLVRRWPQPSDSEPDIDVGFIEISSDCAKGLTEKSFLPLSRVRPFVHFWNNRVFLHGFPSECVPKDLAQNNMFKLNSLGYLTETIKPKDVNYDAKDVSRDIFIDYDEIGVLVGKEDEFKIPHPRGISGGGLWALPETPQGHLWRPQATVLIGIDRSVLKLSPIVVCTQMQHWLSLIAEEYSDLTPCINDHMNLFA